MAVSEGRRVGRDGSVEPVGSTVDVADASYANTIGDAQLTAFWQDGPDFDPEEPAFYYVRSHWKIPTPRWTAYDAKYLRYEPRPIIPDEVRMVQQESSLYFGPDLVHALRPRRATRYVRPS